MFLTLLAFVLFYSQQVRMAQFIYTNIADFHHAYKKCYSQGNKSSLLSHIKVSSEIKYEALTCLPTQNLFGNIKFTYFTPKIGNVLQKTVLSYYSILKKGFYVVKTTFNTHIRTYMFNYTFP